MRERRTTREKAQLIAIVMLGVRAMSAAVFLMPCHTMELGKPP